MTPQEAFRNLVKTILDEIFKHPVIAVIIWLTPAAIALTFEWLK